MAFDTYLIAVWNVDGGLLASSRMPSLDQVHAVSSETMSEANQKEEQIADLEHVKGWKQRQDLAVLRC